MEYYYQHISVSYTRQKEQNVTKEKCSIKLTQRLDLEENHKIFFVVSKIISNINFCFHLFKWYFIHITDTLHVQFGKIAGYVENSEKLHPEKAGEVGLMLVWVIFFIAWKIWRFSFLHLFSSIFWIFLHFLITK